MIIDKNHLIKTKSYSDILKENYQGLFYVDTEDIVNPLGFSFMPGENHPFTEAILSYAKNPKVDAKDTYMKSFYETFSAPTLGEAFFHGKNISHPLYKVPSKKYFVPWFDRMDMGGFGENLAPNHGSHFIGPVSDTFLNNEFNRLKSIYDSIQEKGFDVAVQSDTIRGYFLKKNEEYKFVVVGGNHRVAVLHALGEKMIPVQLHPSRAPVIDYDGLDRFNNVKHHSFTEKEAKEVFNVIFNGQKV